MYVVATTYFGERIRLKCRSKREAIKHLGEHGVDEGWIFKLELQR